MDESIGIWIFILLFHIILICYHFSILQGLVNFQLDQTSPINLCIELEKHILPIIICNCFTLFLSLIIFKSAWFIFLINLFVIIYIFHLKKRSESKKTQIFDPVLIVRDIDIIKMRHFIAVGISLFLSICCFVKIIFILT